MHNEDKPLTNEGKKQNKLVNIFFAVGLVAFYLIFVILAVSMFIEFEEVPYIFMGIVVLILPLVIAFLVWRYLSGLFESYVELKDDVIIIVDYYIFSMKKKKISIRDIEQAKVIRSFPIGFFKSPIPGRTIPAFAVFDFAYIVFYGKNDEYLFKVLETEASQEWLSCLQERQAEIR